MWCNFLVPCFVSIFILILVMAKGLKSWKWSRHLWAFELQLIVEILSLVVALLFCIYMEALGRGMITAEGWTRWPFGFLPTRHVYVSITKLAAVLVNNTNIQQTLSLPSRNHRTNRCITHIYVCVSFPNNSLMVLKKYVPTQEQQQQQGLLLIQLHIAMLIHTCWIWCIHLMWIRLQQSHRNTSTKHN